MNAEVDNEPRPQAPKASVVLAAQSFLAGLENCPALLSRDRKTTQTRANTRSPTQQGKRPVRNISLFVFTGLPPEKNVIWHKPPLPRFAPARLPRPRLVNLRIAGTENARVLVNHGSMLSWFRLTLNWCGLVTELSYEVRSRGPALPVKIRCH